MLKAADARMLALGCVNRQPLATLYFPGTRKAAGYIIEQKDEADRAAHKSQHGTACCCGFNWPMFERVKARLFSVRDREGNAVAILVAFIPGQSGGYATSRVVRTLEGEARDALWEKSNWARGGDRYYSHYGEKPLRPWKVDHVDELIALAKEWWGGLPE